MFVWNITAASPKRVSLLGNNTVAPLKVDNFVHIFLILLTTVFFFMRIHINFDTADNNKLCNYSIAGGG